MSSVDDSQPRTPVELVKVALANSMKCTVVAVALEAHPPDEAAAQLVIDAFANDKLEPWIAALLLGAIRHPLGYATVLRILRAGGRLSSERYAGPALAKIGGAEAFDDLATVLYESGHYKGAYEGAAYGLGLLDDPRATHLVIEAARRELISATTAGHIVWRTAPEASLLAWLASDEPLLRNIAWSAFLSWSADPYTRPYPSLPTRTWVLGALEHAGTAVSPQTREHLYDRFTFVTVDKSPSPRGS